MATAALMKGGTSCMDERHSKWRGINEKAFCKSNCRLVLFVLDGLDCKGGGLVFWFTFFADQWKHGDWLFLCCQPWLLQFKASCREPLVSNALGVVSLEIKAKIHWRLSAKPAHTVQGWSGNRTFGSTARPNDLICFSAIPTVISGAFVEINCKFWNSCYKSLSAAMFMYITPNHPTAFVFLFYK